MSIQIWNEDEIISIANKHLNFLAFLYPFLKESSYHREVVEIRPIGRDKEKAPYIESFNVFRIDEDTISRYIKFLEKINGKPYCLYYSSHCFDNKKDIEGKKRTKINNENALATSVLAMDFDNISIKDFHQIKEKFDELGISTLDIFSGHGVQSLIVLNELCFDTTLLKRWTTLLLRKGIKTDGALIDAARVLRMPNSFNYKAFDKSSKYFVYGKEPEGIFTSIINKPCYKYPVEFVFKKIMELPDVLYPLKDEDIKILEENKKMTKKLVDFREEKAKKEKALIEVSTENKEEVANAYVGLVKVQKLPLPIIKMLNSTPEGIRNKTMFFLVPYLKNSIGYEKQELIEIMKIWGQRCKPRLNEGTIIQETNRLLRYDMKAKFGKYDDELAHKFGYLDFKLERKNKIKIQKQITNNVRDISDTAFKIYLALMNYKSLNPKITNFTAENICEIASISSRTFYRNILDLVTNGIFIKKAKIDKKKREKYSYYINPYISDYGGFTLLERATIKIMLQELNDPEIKLYTVMCSMLYKKSNVWAGQKYLAERLGKKQCTISKIIKGLADKKFITIKQSKNGIMINNIYVLNY